MQVGNTPIGKSLDVDRVDEMAWGKLVSKEEELTINAAFPEEEKSVADDWVLQFWTLAADESEDKVEIAVGDKHPTVVVGKLLCSSEVGETRAGLDGEEDIAVLWTGKLSFEWGSSERNNYVHRIIATILTQISS